MSKQESDFPEPSKIELVTEPIAAGAAAILGLFPIFGAAATTGLTAWQTHNYQKLVRAIRENFERIDQSKLDKSILESDEFKGLVVQVVEAGVRSASTHKCEALARAIINSAVQPTSQFSNKTAILRVIAQMSDEEIFTLKVLYDHEVGQKPNGPFIGTDKIAGQLQTNQSEVLTSLDGLQQLGLAYDFVQTYAGFESRRGLWRITTLGFRSSQYATTQTFTISVDAPPLET